MPDPVLGFGMQLLYRYRFGGDNKEQAPKWEGGKENYGEREDTQG